MKTLTVELGKRSYDIVIEKGLVHKAGEEVRKVYNGAKVFVVTDSNVARHYAEPVLASLHDAGFEAAHGVIPAGEASKNIDMLKTLYTYFLDFGLSRSDLIVALGGGVVGDITGFAAATYLRGVPYIQMPTSLLAQVDSSVGGKVAADLPQGKNLAGAFYQPLRVIMDPDTLDTLEPRYYRDGMGEVIKHGCIYSKDLFDKLLSGEINREDMLYANCAIKSSVVKKDELDRGERMLLNFGHTIGHAIECYHQFSLYSHGEAVAMGMYTITAFSEKRGLTKAGTADQIKALLRKYGLPYECPAMERQKVVDAIAHDKKNLNQQLNLVLLKEIGRSFTYKADPDAWGLIDHIIA